MKQINYLLLATILFFSNCSNDNGVDEMLSEKIVNITEADLVGDWLFESLEFEGKTYTECDDELRKKYDLTNLSFLNVTLKSELYEEPSLIYFSNCGNTTNEERRFTIENNFIKLHNNNSLKFLILNSKNFDKKYLKIELITTSKIIPAGGIYTLKKRL